MTVTRGPFKRRLEARNMSRVRESAISAMIVVILAVGVTYSLPASAIRQVLSPILEPVAITFGLDQNWSLFAPSPPQRQEDIEVHVTMADGIDKVWTLPQRNPIFGVAFLHRWRKFKESLLTTPGIRSDFAHWVVRELTEPGERAVRVEMLLHTEEMSPPPVRGPGQTAVQTLYVENLAGSR